MVTLSNCTRCGNEFFADDPMDQICDPCLKMPGMIFVLSVVNVGDEEHAIDQTFEGFEDMMAFVNAVYPKYTSLLVSILPQSENKT